MRMCFLIVIIMCARIRSPVAVVCYLLSKIGVGVFSTTAGAEGTPVLSCVIPQHAMQARKTSPSKTGVQQPRFFLGCGRFFLAAFGGLRLGCDCDRTFSAKFLPQ
jgi:hypothetical protein